MLKKARSVVEKGKAGNQFFVTVGSRDIPPHHQPSMRTKP